MSKNTARNENATKRMRMHMLREQEVKQDLRGLFDEMAYAWQMGDVRDSTQEFSADHAIKGVVFPNVVEG